MEENFKNESMVDAAYSILKGMNKTVTFNELYDEVANAIGLSEEKKISLISKFYTNLMLDGRFVTLEDNILDLREKLTYDKVHIDMNAVYTSIDEDAKGNADVSECDDTDEKIALGIEDDDSIDKDDVSKDYEGNE